MYSTGTDQLMALSTNSNNSTLGAEFKVLIVSLHALDTYLGFEGSSLKAFFAESSSD